MDVGEDSVSVGVKDRVIDSGDEAMDYAGLSDDSDTDHHYVPPKHPLSSSDSESGAGTSFTPSRRVQAGVWRLRLGAPAKVSKLGRSAAKVS